MNENAVPGLDRDSGISPDVMAPVEEPSPKRPLWVGRLIRGLVSLIPIALLMVVGFAVAPFVRSVLPIPHSRFVSERVLRALVDQDWASVASDIGAIPPAERSTIDAFLLAHADLALNHNNASLVEFQQASKQPALLAWDEWTRWYARAYPNTPSAHYLRGDAQFRLGKTTEAIESFTRALKIDPHDRLARNARGVAYARLSKATDALEEMNTGIKPTSPFADAYCSRGVLYLQTYHNRRSASLALADFNRALKISPDFGLALIGRGCAHFVLKEKELAVKDFRAASDKCPLLEPIARANIAAMIGFAGGDKSLALLPLDQLGMAINRHIMELVLHPNKKTADNLINDIGVVNALQGPKAVQEIFKKVHETSIINHNTTKVSDLLMKEFRDIHNAALTNEHRDSLNVKLAGSLAKAGSLSIGATEKFKDGLTPKQNIGKDLENAIKGNVGPIVNGALLTMALADVDDGRWPDFQTSYGLTLLAQPEEYLDPTKIEEENSK